MILLKYFIKLPAFSLILQSYQFIDFEVGADYSDTFSIFPQKLFAYLLAFCKDSYRIYPYSIRLGPAYLLFYWRIN